MKIAIFWNIKTCTVLTSGYTTLMMEAANRCVTWLDICIVAPRSENFKSNKHHTILGEAWNKMKVTAAVCFVLRRRTEIRHKQVVVHSVRYFKSIN
jgi:hypothetical protein